MTGVGGYLQVRSPCLRGSVRAAVRPVAALAVAAGVVVPCAAMAQAAPQAAPSLLRDTSGSAAAIAVNSRARPGYEPLGIDVGGFMLLPSATVSAGYDSNLYASSLLKVADGFVVDAPRLVARSRWTRHQLTLVADANIRRYFNRSIANSEQYGLDADGTLDILRQTKLNVTGTIGRKIEPRGTEGDIFIGSEPIGYRQIVTQATLTQDMGLLHLEGGAGYANYKYEDTILNGQVVDLAFRDFNSVTFNGRVAYSVSPSFSPFVSASYNKSTYPNSPILTDRNSHGYQILGGLAFDITALIAGQVGVGYIRQSFDSPEFPDVSGFSYRAAVVWNPTTLTTVTFSANRAIQRGPVIGVAGIVLSTAQVAVDHEFLRNLLLHADVVYANGSYRGLARSDRRVGGTLTARYYLNRNLSVALTDSYVQQRPGAGTTVGRSYDRNQILASATIQM